LPNIAARSAPAANRIRNMTFPLHVGGSFYLAK